MLDFAFVVGKLAVGDHLHVALRRAVVELDKREASLAVAPRPHPALQRGDLANRLLAASFGDREFIGHGTSLSKPFRRRLYRERAVGRPAAPIRVGTLSRPTERHGGRSLQ